MKLNRKEATFIIEITKEVNVFLVTSRRIEGLSSKDTVLTLMAMQTAGLLTEFRRMELLNYVKSAINFSSPDRET
jgi:hypothetical protein